MSNRTVWSALPWVFMNGQAHVMTQDAAAYLGMHEKAFLALAKKLGVSPDNKLRKLNLYTRGTLDNIDRQRGKPGPKPRINP